MKDKFTVYSLQFTVLIAVFLLLLLSPVTYNLKPIFAQTISCGGTQTARADKLVTTPSLIGKFGTSANVCIIDPAVVFAPFKIKTYDDLKVQYYTQSQASKQTITAFATFSDQNVYLASPDLTISSSPTGSGIAVVFVEGNLNISSNISVTGSNTGLVLVVKNNIFISPDVTQINAVLIAQGSIYTAAASNVPCSIGNPVQTSALTINGSLISLDETKPPQFCRTLLDNRNPAEVINHQVKYLVLLRQIFSETLQRWFEVP